jgi:hypothetical protein
MPVGAGGFSIGGWRPPNQTTRTPLGGGSPAPSIQQAQPRPAPQLAPPPEAAPPPEMPGGGGVEQPPALPTLPVAELPDAGAMGAMGGQMPGSMQAIAEQPAPPGSLNPNLGRRTLPQSLRELTTMAGRNY